MMGDSDEEFKEMSIKLNEFTTLLNKYYKEYKVEFWGEGEGVSLSVDDIEIQLALAGGLHFKKSEEEDETKN